MDNFLPYPFITFVYERKDICIVVLGVIGKSLIIFRMMLAYVYIPIIQKELDIFKTTIWNNHRGRKQKNKELPDGIPEHIYNFPEHYGAAKCGTPVSDQNLEEVAEVSNILENTNDYLDAEFRSSCETVIPDVNDITPSEAANAFCFLKQNIDF